MFKLLAFLLILCVLFGVETTRELFFGTVGFIFWAIVILVGAGLLITAFEGHAPAKDEERKKVEPKPATRGDKIAYAVAILILVIVFFLWRFAHDNGL